MDNETWVCLQISHPKTKKMIISFNHYTYIAASYFVDRIDTRKKRAFNFTSRADYKIVERIKRHDKFVSQETFFVEFDTRSDPRII